MTRKKSIFFAFKGNIVDYMIQVYKGDEVKLLGDPALLHVIKERHKTLDYLVAELRTSVFNKGTGKPTWGKCKKPSEYGFY